MGGSSSKSDSKQSTSNTSTSFGVQGDNNGFITNGSGNSYNITQTDHGLVDGLVDIWGDMAGNQREMTIAAENMTKSGFNFASDVNRDSLDFAGETLADAYGFGGDALSAMQDSQNQAFNFGADALQMTGNLATDSINAQNSLAETSIKENSDLARSVTEMAENMHGNNTAFANNAILTVSDSLGDANNNMADLAYFSIENNSNLATDLAAGAVDKVADAYQDAGDQTILAHKQALQFADHASRSDGQQLAISTNETMKYIVIGLGGVAILAVVFMGRK
ncbi:hypothetical protein FHG08_11520 [Pseudoalteromonas sp. Scap03]|uniref:hypothetical protein n=1 Tax=unclassified Pseudoalteromonas TaxID=194690 RepID=UPI0015B9D90B|nr:MULTISPECIES: hypothetical protein [unclassified Pseudoalteromonas]NWL16320.1 hypothetical protein [Pseudoalteromonas sp. Scap03]QLE81438.1 hypothetical protein FLM54_07775 [Pseudoalteromonas sp. Scap25]QLE89382.1 hypothetical protein FLM47_07770 [Pseudoalteromonas sp. Scap06]